MKSVLGEQERRAGPPVTAKAHELGVAACILAVRRNKRLANRFCQTVKMAATSLARGQSALGAFYWRQCGVG